MRTPYFIPSLESLYRDDPLVIVDVGARAGLQQPWRDLEPYLRVVGFEPDTRSFEQLKVAELPSRVNIMVGLYREKARKPLYLTRDEGDSSILEPNRELLQQFPRPERFDVVRQSEIELDTLDRQMAIHHVTDIDFIKIDTQGSELYVLEGATEAVGKCALGVEVEVEFVELYRNQPLFPEVHAFMLRHGFQLVDLRPVYWKREIGKDFGRPKGLLTWADALYFKELSKLPAMMEHLSSERQVKAKCLKAMAVSVAYGYFDHALTILDLMAERFSSQERDQLRAELRKLGEMDVIPNFPGRRLLARALYHGWRNLRPRRDSWHLVGSGQTLGNLE